MASINMDSIIAKAKSCMSTSKKKAEVQNAIDNVLVGKMKIKTGGGSIVHTAEDAAIKFEEVLLKSINSSGLSANAISAISNIDHTSPKRIGSNMYIIDIYFEGDLSRPSLDPSHYDDIHNIAALFNKGVDHTMRPVRGEWHGVETWSRTRIPGTHFIENAVSDFMGNYASEYNVLDISIDDVYR